MDIDTALDILASDKQDDRHTLSEQMTTYTIIKSLKTASDPSENNQIRKTLSEELGSRGEILYFACSLQPVSRFFDSVVILADCRPDAGIPILLQALTLAKCFNMCKRLILEVDVVSAHRACLDDGDELIEVWGRGLTTFRLKSRTVFTLDTIPNWNGLIFCIQGLEMAKHTLRNLTLSHVGLGFTRSTDIFSMLCDKFIKNNFVLSVLDLSNNFLQDRDVTILLDALETCPGLTCLDLSDNSLTPAGVSEIEKRCRQLVELNLGTVPGFAGVLPQAVLTMNLNAFHFPLKPQLLTMIQNPEGEKEDPAEDILIFHMGQLIDITSSTIRNAITDVAVIMYDDKRAKSYTKALLNMPSIRQLLPALKRVEVFGCDAMENLNWTEHPTAAVQSCLRQDNTHIVLDDITRHASALLNIILAGANIPFGEEVFKDDTAVDKLYNFDIMQYYSFWADMGLRFTDSTANPDNQDQVVTTTVTLLATNPAPGQHRFVLKNKAKLYLNLYQEDRANEGCDDNLPYRGHVHIKFLKPSRAESTLFATTTDTHVNKLLQHSLLSADLKKQLKRAGLALKSCCHWD